MDPTFAAALTGGLFGSALTISGVAAPSAIIGQFQFSDHHMVLTFLTASACGAPIFLLANRSQHVQISARQNSSFGWAGKFDGNVIGGTLLGIGMGLTGACPGTVLVQAAAGVAGSQLLLASGALAGVLYIPWSQSNPKKPTAPAGKHSLSEATGYSFRTVLGTYEAALLAMITAALYLAPKGRYTVHPAVGGVLIGLAQASSVYFTKKPLGASAAYEDIGKIFWGSVRGTKMPGIQNLIFAAGVMAGARLTMQALPETAIAFAHSTGISPLRAILGGFALIFGARMAGGCTSGHGITGMSTLGVSSFVTVPCMFAGGILAAMLLKT
ncbi:YeeE/YedE family protein [Zymoseptoria brevis]|uniref:YeeE/YedE family protein n=1 Tax=Zymoseptoria brevis TaxID=1047168 RepID=A0A0F4GI02_9PEZI|nr:YeeE/YedE family protein [Zymoseptoria brevis]